MNVNEAAASYIELGYKVVPLSPRTKEPYSPDWRKIIFRPDDFKENDNIGIKFIEGVVDIDLDSPECVALADTFLPSTDAIYGRPSKPRCHRLYRSKIEQILQLIDYGATTEKNMLVEIRVDHQSMAPYSIHPEGEQVSWHKQGSPGEVEGVELTKSVQLLATCAMLVRYYAQQGARNIWFVPLTGVFRQLGIAKEDAVRVVGAAAKQANDEELKKRLEVVDRTYALSEDTAIASVKALLTVMPNGQIFIDSLKKIWRIEGGKDHRGFICGKGGSVIPNNQHNIIQAMEKLGVEWYHDTFAHKLFVNKMPLDEPLMDRLWLTVDSRFHFQPSYSYFMKVVMDNIRKNEVHPVKDYLNSLNWDGKSRIDKWLTEYGKAEDSSYVRAVSSIILIAAVRRVRHPGCKFDEMLIIESDQGKNKSTALYELCPNPAWLSDDLPLGASSKETIERTSGCWIVEAQELFGRKREAERLKSFLSRRKDGPVRLAYERLPVEVLRQFVIIGTTNPSLYLKDPTGNRRFWPVLVEKFDVEAIRRDRDQLWAEAAHREAAGDSIRLSPSLYGDAQTEQDGRMDADPWEPILIEKFGHEKYVRSAASEVWDAVNVPIDRRTEWMSSRISQIMIRLGFRSMTIRKGESITRGWGRGHRSQRKLDV